MSYFFLLRVVLGLFALGEPLASTYQLRSRERYRVHAVILERLGDRGTLVFYNIEDLRGEFANLLLRVRIHAETQVMEQIV